MKAIVMGILMNYISLEFTHPCTEMICEQVRGVQRFGYGLYPKDSGAKILFFSVAVRGGGTLKNW